MSQTPEFDPAADRAQAAPAQEQTGHPAVDAVLESLGRLEESPVAEHPVIFEQAHDALRSALTQARENPGSAPDGS